MSEKTVQKRYQVQPEDTLRTIAQKFGVTVKDLAVLNGISNRNPLYAGEFIMIPPRPLSAPRSNLAPWLMLGGVTIVVGVLLGLLFSSNQQAATVALNLTQAQNHVVEMEQTSTQAVVNFTQTAVAWTATPSPTLAPLPTIAAGALGKQWSAAASDAQFKSNEMLGSGSFSVVEIWGADPSYQAHAYISQGASLKVISVDQTSGSLVLQSETGDFLVRTGSFNGVNVRSRGSSVEFGLAGSCMVVNNDPAQLSMACLEGTCSYTTVVGDPSVALPVGSKIIFDKAQTTPQIVSITLADVTDYLDNMEQIGGQTGLIDLNECGLQAYQSSSGSARPTTAAKATSTKTSSSAQTCKGNLVLQNGSCVCPSGTVRSGDQCVRPSGQSGQSVQPTAQPVGQSVQPVEPVNNQPPPPTAVPSCDGGRFWNGSSCVCSNGTLWNGASCVNPEPTCSGGQVWNGGACVCPDGRIWDGSWCVDPVPTCSGGQSWNGSSCECSSGTIWDGDSCEYWQPTCPGGQHLEGDSCVNDAPTCGPGQHLDGSNQCVNDVPVCGGNQYYDGNQCIDIPPPECPAGQHYDGVQCVSDGF